MPICPAETALLRVGRAEKLAAVWAWSGTWRRAALEMVMCPLHSKFVGAAFLAQSPDNVNHRFAADSVQVGSQRFRKNQFRDWHTTARTGFPPVFRKHVESGMLGHESRNFSLTGGYIVHAVRHTRKHVVSRTDLSRKFPEAVSADFR